MFYEEPLKDEHSGRDVRHDRRLKGQLRLGSRRAVNKTTRKTFRLEVMKRAVRISNGLASE
jgi:hypothetical protein